MCASVKCKHTNLQPQCRHCAKLQATWEAKLEKSGVANIEQPDGNLKKWHSFMFGRHEAHLLNLPSREQYYRMARHFLWDYSFRNKMDRRAWELHSEGASIRDIVTVLVKEFRRYTFKRKVHESLQKIAKEMLNQCRKQ